MVTCFENVLVTCDSYDDFFRYRDLLRAVALVQDWLCEDVIQRFSGKKNADAKFPMAYYDSN